jgi:hypothetical protein
MNTRFPGQLNFSIAEPFRHYFRTAIREIFPDASLTDSQNKSYGFWVWCTVSFDFPTEEGEKMIAIPSLSRCEVLKEMAKIRLRQLKNVWMPVAEPKE